MSTYYSQFNSFAVATHCPAYRRELNIRSFSNTSRESGYNQLVRCIIKSNSNHTQTLFTRILTWMCGYILLLGISVGPNGTEYYLRHMKYRWSPCIVDMFVSIRLSIINNSLPICGCIYENMYVHNICYCRNNNQLFFLTHVFVWSWHVPLDSKSLFCQKPVMILIIVRSQTGSDQSCWG